MATDGDHSRKHDDLWNGWTSGRAAIASITQGHQSAAVSYKRTKALLPPSQRPAVAVEIEENWMVLVRRHVPDDHLLTVSVSSITSSASDRPAARGAVRRRSGKYWSDRWNT